MAPLLNRQASAQKFEFLPLGICRSRALRLISRSCLLSLLYPRYSLPFPFILWRHQREPWQYQRATRYYAILNTARGCGRGSAVLLKASNRPRD